MEQFSWFCVSLESCASAHILSASFLVFVLPRYIKLETSCSIVFSQKVTWFLTLLNYNGNDTILTRTFRAILLCESIKLKESAMLTIDSDRDIQAHCCSNDVGNLATVDKQSSRCHCSVPNSCTAAVTDHNIVLIQVISKFLGVGICHHTVENDICTFADFIFTYLQLNSLWWICQRSKPSQYSCHHNKLSLISVSLTW